MSFKRLLTLTIAGTALLGMSSLGYVKNSLQKAADNVTPVSPAALLSQTSGDSATVILDSQGGQTDAFSIARRIPLTYDAIPLIVRQAFVAAEDRNFWTHNGVDYPSLIRAAITNLTTGRHEGGSSIPQQVIKNYVTGNARTLDRKTREAVLAMALVRDMPRSQILQVYLNGLWLGHGAYGVGAGSVAWFHHPLATVSIAEAAFLAGLARGPAIMEPQTHPDRARARRSYVLDRMVAAGNITAQEAAVAKLAPLPVPDSLANTGIGKSYYTETVREIVLGQRGAEGVYSGGSLIRTWQSEPLQAIADAALQNGLLSYDARHGWRGDLKDIPASWKTGKVISCDKAAASCAVLPSGTDSPITAKNPYGATIRAGYTVGITPDGLIAERPQADGGVILMSPEGHVLAESGGFWRGHTTFNRATQSMRQVGSTIKPFVALTALQYGWTPETVVADVPVSVSVPGAAEDWQPGGDGHDDGMGLISLRDALAQSRNQAFVRLGMDVGLDAVWQTFYALGIYPQSQRLSPASLLGATETTLLRMTTAYASLVANAGHPIHATYIQTDAAPAMTPDAENGVIPDTAPVLSMLSSVTNGGTAEAAFSSLPASVRATIGGKTGTSNNVMDSWYIGYSGSLVVGVHVGGDTPFPLGDREYGSTIAAPIAAEIIGKAPKP